MPALCVAVAAIGAAVPAPGAASTRAGLTIVSGRSRLPAECRPATGPVGVYDVDAEIRPVAAVRATDPNQLVAAWKQDPNSSVALARSTDAGRTWSSVVPPTGSCTGGTPMWRGGNDPELAAGGDGTFYLAAQVWDAGGTDTGHAASGVVVLRSVDGGATWAPPTLLQSQDFGPAFAVTAHATDPRSAFVAASAPPALLPGFVRVWRTSDSGVTWDELALLVLPAHLRAVYVRNVFSFDDGGLLVLAAFEESAARGQVAIRSTDGGSSWHPPVVVPAAPGFGGESVHDPRDGALVVQSTFVASASAPDGTVVVVWPHVESVTSSRIMAVASPDGGATWGDPYVIREAGHQLFLTAPAVGEGGIGVTYYSAPRTPVGSRQFPAAVRFARSRDGGATWQDVGVTPRMNLRKAMMSSAVNRMWLGYRHALVPRHHGFVAVFPVTDTLVRRGKTDIAFRHLK